MLLATFFLLPFINKAHTIDDTTFLFQAEHVLKDPLHPTAFEMVADGNRIRLSSQLVSGPVMAYLLVPSVLLGGAEFPSHLIQLFLMLVAIIATVSLAYRLGSDHASARNAGLLLASTPAVIVMATTSMPDIPAMTFGTLGMERFFAWRREGKWMQATMGSACFALAALSRPHLILILVVAAMTLLAFREKGFIQSDAADPQGHPLVYPGTKFTAFIPLIAASIMILIAAILTADPVRTQSDFLSITVSRFKPANSFANTVAFFVHWMLVFPLAFLWIGFRTRCKSLSRNPALWLALAVPVLIAAVHGSNTWTTFLVMALALAGALVILDIFVDSWRRRDWVQLFLAAWLLISLPAIAYVHLPSRYLVGSAPAVAILLARFHQGNRPDRRMRRLMTWAGILAGILLSLFITAADTCFTAMSKRVALEQIAPMVARGVRVWSNGGWGFAWYAHKAGAIPLSDQPPYPTSGDFLVSTSVAPNLTLVKFPNRQLVKTISETSRLGRIMNSSASAGFYSNGYGYLPWTWHNGGIEYITIWKIP
jgi:hypothetical protein